MSMINIDIEELEQQQRERTQHIRPTLQFNDDYNNQYEHPPSYAEATQNNNPVNDDGILKTSSFWTFQYYQQFFDVTTEQVVNRIKWSMIPHPSVNYFQNYIRPNPDLYGPFWICITLIFTIAISGNLANYLQTASSHNYHWKYDFHVVTLAATTILNYAFFLPFIFWALSKWNIPSQADFTLLEVICIYGYCLSIYIPVSVLWVIQIGWLQWFLVMIGAVLSGGVLTKSLFFAFNKNLPFSAIVFVLHFILALGFMLYFFHVPSISGTHLNVNSTITKT